MSELDKIVSSVIQDTANPRAVSTKKPTLLKLLEPVLAIASFQEQETLESKEIIIKAIKNFPQKPNCKAIE